VAGLCDFPPAVFPVCSYPLAVVAVAPSVAVAISVSVTAVPITSAVVAVIVAVPAAPVPPLIPAMLAQLVELVTVMSCLAAVVAVALDVAAELPFLLADALTASIVPVTRLSGCAGQHGPTQQHCRAQSGRP